MDSERKRLLIIDDEPLNRELLRRVLQASYELSEAEDAAEALEIMEGGETINLILCDHLMPGQTGAALASDVSERWPGIPFILLTGCDTDDDVREAHQRGMVQLVVTKPWRSKELRLAIEKELGGAEA